MHPLPAALVPLLFLSPAADGWLGIFLEDRSDAAIVAEVIPDSPAAKAGLQAGDELLAVDDQATATRDQFVAAIRKGKPGDRVSIKLRRAGQEQIVVVRLGERPEAVPARPPATAEGQKPAQPAAPAPVTEPKAGAGMASSPRGYLGLSVRESEGHIVVDRVLPDGPAAAAGVRAGDTIVKLGERDVASLADLDAALQRSTPGMRLPIGLRSDAGARSVIAIVGERPSAGVAAAPIEPAPRAAAAVPPTPPTPPAPPRTARDVDVEAELAALRAELAELRRQLEQLRKERGRE